MSISRVHWFAACTMLALATIAQVHAATPVRAAPTKWYEVRTADFHVISAVSAGQTRRIVQDVELYQAAMQKVINGMSVHPNVPATMFLLDQRQWKRHVPLRRDAAGVVYVYPSMIHILVDADSWISAAPIVFHELTHVLLQQNSGGQHLPVWYNEGYADFFSTIQQARGGIEMGKAPWWRWLELKNLPWMPLQEVLGVEPNSPEYRGERLASSFYATSWLMIHYGVFEKPERGRQLEQYRALLSSGLDRSSAFAKAFAGDDGAFERELVGYAKQTKFRYVTMSLPQLAQVREDDVKQLPDSVALDALAGWMLTTRDADDERLKFFSKLADGAAPDSVAALQLAAAHSLRTESSQARALAEKGCGGVLSNPRIAMLCGDVYLDIARSDEQLGADKRAELARQSRRYYAAVLESDPDNVEALLSSSYSVGLAPFEDSMAREGLERLWQRPLRSAAVARAIGLLYVNKDAVKARHYLEQALLLATDQDAERKIIAELHAIEAAMAIPR